jgi:hypothetical protein
MSACRSRKRRRRQAIRAAALTPVYRRAAAGAAGRPTRLPRRSDGRQWSRALPGTVPEVAPADAVYEAPGGSVDQTEPRPLRDRTDSAGGQDAWDTPRAMRRVAIVGLVLLAGLLPAGATAQTPPRRAQYV